MSIHSELAKVVAPNTPRARTAVNYTTATSRTAPKRGTIPADRGYETQTSRADRMPKGATADHILGANSYDEKGVILSGASELEKLLTGQPLVVKQNVFVRVAALKSSPKVNTVRQMIMQEIQRVEREG